jgi:tRNA U38,U39,U40 pseudouridine synthase TruA
VQFDAVTSTLPRELLQVFNSRLPEDMRVVAAEIVHSKFSAMDTLWKRYVYRIRDEDCPAVLSHGPPPSTEAEGVPSAAADAEETQADPEPRGAPDIAAMQQGLPSVGCVEMPIAGGVGIQGGSRFAG